MTSAPSSATRHASWPLQALAALLVPAAVLPAFAGFPQFDVIQSAAATVVAALLALGLLIAHRRRPEDDSSPASPLAAWVLFGVAAFALVRAALGDSTSEAFDDVVRWTLLAAAGLAIAFPPNGRSLRPGLGAGLGAALVIASVTALLQRTGRTFPEPIPFITDPGGPARAFFDDPHVAAAFFALAMPLVVALVPGPRPLRWGLLAFAALGASVTTGWLWLLIAGFVLAILGGIGLLDTRDRSAPDLVVAGALLALASAVVAFAPAAYPPPDTVQVWERRMAQAPKDHAKATFWAEPDAWDAYRAAGIALALDSPILGHGPGSVVGSITRHMPIDAPYATRATRGLRAVERSPLPLADATATLGAVPLLAIAALLLVGVFRSRDDEDPSLRRAAAAFAVIAWFGFAGLLTAAPLVLLGLLIALAAPRDAGGAPRAALVVALALTMAAAAFAARHATWGYHFAGGIVFYEHGRNEQAREAFLRAAAVDERFASEFNLGIIESLIVGEQRDPVAIADRLKRATELRRADTRSRRELANHWYRSIAALVNTESELLERRSTIISLLSSVLEREPNHAEAGLLLSRILTSQSRGEESAAVLTRLADRPLPPDVLADVFWELSKVQADMLEDPRAAERSIARAMELEPDQDRVRRMRPQLDLVQTWIRMGRRPEYEGSLGRGEGRERPGAHLHDHDHEHGEGHDHDHDHGATPEDLGAVGYGSPMGTPPAEGSGSATGHTQSPAGNDAPTHEHGHDHDHDHDHDHEH